MKRLHIFLAFLSLVNRPSMDKPNEYHIFDDRFHCIQTNEPAVLYMQEKLIRNGERGLDRLYLLVSNDVKTGTIPSAPGISEETHYDFFCRRLGELFQQGILSGLPVPEMIPIDLQEAFDRTSPRNLSDECHIAVIETARQIIEDYGPMLRSGDAELMLHADMTGGYRYISMALLAVMQLLSYSGFTIATVLYADPYHSDPAQRLSEITDTLNLTTLIKGADEFVRGGSIQAIKEYFGPQIFAHKETTDLLNTMERFSNAVRLCRTDEIADSMQEISDQIDAFAAIRTKSIPENFFSYLLARIRDEYAKVLSPEADAIKIIEWCCAKGLWQQALTFIEARMPQYFIAHHIIYPSAPALWQEKTDLIHPHWEQNFILCVGQANAAKNEAPQISAESTELFLSALENAKDLSDEVIESWGISPDEFHALLHEIECFDKRLAELRKKLRPNPQGQIAYPASFFEKNRTLAYLLRLTYLIQGNHTQDFLAFIQKTVTQKILIDSLKSHIAEGLQSQVAVRALFQVFRTKKKQKEKEKHKQKQQPKTWQEKWEKRRQGISAALADGEALTDWPGPRDKILELLEAYNELRLIRHQTNHASAADDALRKLTVTDINSKIRSFLHTLQTIRSGNPKSSAPAAKEKEVSL